MLKTLSDLMAHGPAIEIDTGLDAGTAAWNEAGCRFYPVSKENVSIQKIVEGMRLAEIELVSIPEYGVHIAS